MQQTEKYKLNLIDPEDDFSPEPLNRNAETVEAQLQAREAAEAVLDTKFTAAIGAGGSNARVATVSFTGGYNRSVTFDFKPLAVLLACNSYGMGYDTDILIRGMGAGDTATSVSWRNNGLTFTFGDDGLTGYCTAIGESL